MDDSVKNDEPTQEQPAPQDNQADEPIIPRSGMPINDLLFDAVEKMIKEHDIQVAEFGVVLRIGNEGYHTVTSHGAVATLALFEIGKTLCQFKAGQQMAQEQQSQRAQQSRVLVPKR